MVAAGTSHFCALTETGVVWVWGSNDFGQLGTRGDTDVNAPNHWYIKSCGTPFVMVACVGRRFACCRTAGSMRAAKRGRVRTGMPTATTGTGSGECAVSRISSWWRPGWGTRRRSTAADETAPTLLVPSSCSSCYIYIYTYTYIYIDIYIYMFIYVYTFTAANKCENQLKVSNIYNVSGRLMQCFINFFESCYKACVMCDILKCWMEILRRFTSNPRSINFFWCVANFSF